MPYFAVNTNVPKDKVPSDFLKKTTAFLAKMTEKPEAYFCVHLKAGQQMARGGTTEPAGFVYFMSCGGFGAEIQLKYSAQICKYMKETLGIPDDRLFIQFRDEDPQNVGTRGETVAELFQQLRQQQQK